MWTQVWLLCVFSERGGGRIQSVWYLTVCSFTAIEVAAEVTSLCSAIHAHKAAVLVGVGELPKVCSGWCGGMGVVGLVEGVGGMGVVEGVGGMGVVMEEWVEWVW